MGEDEGTPSDAAQKLAAVQVRSMLDESIRTREAVDELRTSLEGRRELTDKAISDLRAEVRDDIRDVKALVEDAHHILVGEQGDNGLTARVLLLEKAKGQVSWGTVAVIVTLALMGLGVYLRN